MIKQIKEIDIDIRVRYSEVDQMGALHHSRYWVYFEIGRTELLREAGFAYADLEREGVLFVVSKCEAKYHSPARYDDELVLHAEVVRAGAARLDHEYKLTRKSDGTLICTAATTIASISSEGNIIPIPDNIKATIPDEVFKRRR